MKQQDYRSRSKAMILAGYKIRVRKNPEGAPKVYTRYWADSTGKLLGEVGDPDLEQKLLEAAPHNN